MTAVVLGSWKLKLYSIHSQNLGVCLHFRIDEMTANRRQCPRNSGEQSGTVSWGPKACTKRAEQGRAMGESRRSRERASSILGTTIRDGIKHLCRAWILAQDAERPPPEFGVEIRCLHRIGLTATELRWLLCKGYIEHYWDLTLPGERGRTTRRVFSLRFSKSSCFALTQAGWEFAEEFKYTSQMQMRHDTNPNADERRASSIPAWNATSRQLTVDGFVVKTFQVPSSNQELILTAFEEEGWVAQIDNPLPPRKNVNCRTRLNQTLYRLNRSLVPPLIHFSCSNGHRVYWEPMNRPSSSSP